MHVVQFGKENYQLVLGPFWKKTFVFFLYRLMCITFDILFQTRLQMSSDCFLIYQTQSVFDGDQSDIKFISGYMMLTCNITTLFFSI